MGRVMLEIKDLWVEIEGRSILKGVELTVAEGEAHILFGPNGSGKSTLLASVMGLPGYRIVQGGVWFRGERIDGLSPDEIAQKGVGLAFQRPPAIKGVKLETFIRAIAKVNDCAPLYHSLELDSLKDRELNAGFSGGELKRSEMLKIAAQSPDLVMLDEPESGVDLEHIAIISAAIKTLLAKDHSTVHRRRAGLIITHTGYILDSIEADQGHVFIDGRIVCTANPRTLFHEIQKHGYEGSARFLGQRSVGDAL
nr:ABC transporter ATP-binding protein [uncultured Desulfobulbus sp.]